MAEAADRVTHLREAILARARVLGLEGADEEATIEAVLDREVAVPAAGEDECRRYYEAHPAEFAAGASVSASHILFAIRPGSPVEAIRRKAEETLLEARTEPAKFAALARERSNCPSGADGGRLGPLSRGEALPEFERAIFEAGTDGILPRLVMTRHGFHVVRIDAREAGTPVPFEAVREAIARHLETRVEAKALRQYAGVLEGGSPLTR